MPGLPAGLPDHVVRLFGDGRFRHAQPVQAVAFSPDGRRLVSASREDGAVIVWDADAGRALTRYTGHADKVWCVAFSPDGKTVASGGEDKTIKLWDVDTGKDVRSLGGHTDFVTCLAFSPDGKYLATGAGGNDKHVRIYDLASNGMESSAGRCSATRYGRHGRRLEPRRQVHRLAWEGRPFPAVRLEGRGRLDLRYRPAHQAAERAKVQDRGSDRRRGLRGRRLGRGNLRRGSEHGPAHQRGRRRRADGV